MKGTAGGPGLPLALALERNASPSCRHLAPPKPPLLGIMRASLFAGSFFFEAANYAVLWEAAACIPHALGEPGEFN